MIPLRNHLYCSQYLIPVCSFLITDMSSSLIMSRGPALAIACIQGKAKFSLLIVVSKTLFALCFWSFWPKPANSHLAVLLWFFVGLLRRECVFCTKTMYSLSMSVLIGFLIHVFLYVDLCSWNVLKYICWWHHAGFLKSRLFSNWTVLGIVIGFSISSEYFGLWKQTSSSKNSSRYLSCHVILYTKEIAIAETILIIVKVNNASSDLQHTLFLWVHPRRRRTRTQGL